MPLGSSMGSVGRRSALALLCALCIHTMTSPILRRGDWVIHFALQALQLHATPANPSPHRRFRNWKHETSRNFCVSTHGQTHEPRLYASNNLVYPWDCIWLSLFVPSPCEFCKS